jgi:hypothetical protein
VEFGRLRELWTIGLYAMAKPPTLPLRIKGIVGTEEGNEGAQPPP